MKKVAYIADNICLKHDTGSMHPESKERLVAIKEAVLPLREKLFTPSPMCVSDEMLLSVHSHKQIEEVMECSKMATSIDADTICSFDSFHVAKIAAGAGIVAIDGIKKGVFEHAFCAVRPPGHHASPTKSMGFCLFNNIAISAKYAQKKGYKKVMIIDFDVHHGNGTQDTFWEDNTVFYISSHQALAYPGTGLENHIGEGKGKGFTRNFLMMPESTDEHLLDIYEHDIPSLVDTFNPDIILVSAGYDLHESDPLAALNITTEGIQKMVRAILDYKDIPYIFFLEGGYDVKALGKNVRATLEEMLY
ncbi:MAG: histone deacetylase [Sulfurovum sp.]|nr:histone deacetylase [Sulfurovum sp.]